MGGQGPDLEEMMRRMQERFRGNGGGNDAAARFGRGAGVLGAILAAGWLASGVYVINEGEQGVVTTFGAFTSVANPGLGAHWPWPVQSIRIEPVSLQRQAEIGQRNGKSYREESSMLTRDQSIVDVNFIVQWRIKDIKSYVFNVRSPDELVFAVAESAMREVVGQRDLDQIITTQRSEVQNSTRELMQRTLDSYKVGVEIAQVQLQSAAAPAEVIDAFNDVLRAEQEAEATINEANSYRNQIVPQARGDAQKQLQDASAYREQVVREAKGEAARFNQIYEQYRLNPRVTRQRLYLETVERVYGGANKVIVDGKAGSLNYLPLDRLLGAKPAQAEGTQPQASAR
jgi:modulator of FtsH protease HflK